MFTLPDIHLGYAQNLQSACPRFGVWRLPEASGRSWLVALGRWELVLSI